MYKALAIILTLWVLAIAPARAQWTEPIRISEPGRFLYPSIEYSCDTLHVIADYDEGDDLLRYYRSLDGGDLWTPAFIVPDPQMTDGCILPSMSVIGSNVCISWLNIFFPGNNDLNIGFRASTSGGSSWLPSGLVLDQDRWSIGTQAVGVASNFIYVIYSEYLNSALYLLIAKSMDNGQTWSDPEPIYPIHEITGRGVDTEARGDTIHIIWSGLLDSAGAGQVYYFHSTNGGNEWSEMMNLRGIEELGAGRVCISCNDNGRLVACWKDYRYAPFGFKGDIFCRLSFDSGNSWDDEVQLTYAHESIIPEIDWAGDYIYVVYEDWRFNRKEIWYQHSSDNGQSWISEERLTDDYIEDRNPAVEGVTDGRVYVVYSKITSNPDSLEYTGVYLKRYGEPAAIGDKGRGIPGRMDILSAYPNPFNSSIALSIILSKGGETKIEIFDIRGRLVKTIYKGGNLQKGTHKFTWDATDASGKAVSSGLYFAVAGTPQGKITKTLTLIR
jgi:hypothetical protein